MMKKVIKSSASASANADLNLYDTFKLGKKRFSVHYNNIDNGPAADPVCMLRQFEATISEIHPYDDADYAWARLGKGVVDYYRSNKHIDKSYYGTSDDMDVENEEWCDAVLYGVAENLADLNRDVEPRMIHN